MTNLEALTLGYLSKHCRGAAAARKLWKIAEDLAVLGAANANERSIREVLAELRLAGLPVGTTCGDPPGAFLCETTADYRLAYRNLYTRLRHQARGCRRFRRTFREAVARQFRFQFAEAEAAYRLLSDEPLLAAQGPVDVPPPRGAR
jgi:hypothetical protein